jgi:hypothetical protein
MIAVYLKKHLIVDYKTILKLNKKELIRQKKNMSLKRRKLKKDKNLKTQKKIQNYSLSLKKEFFPKLIMLLTKLKRFSMLFV